MGNRWYQIVIVGDRQVIEDNSRMKRVITSILLSSIFFCLSFGFNPITAPLSPLSTPESLSPPSPPPSLAPSLLQICLLLLLLLYRHHQSTLLFGSPWNGLLGAAQLCSMHNKWIQILAAISRCKVRSRSALVFPMHHKLPPWCFPHPLHSRNNVAKK